MEETEDELGERLMPEGLEWPRFEDGKQITCDDAPEYITAVCLALDGSCYALHYDMPDDERMHIYEVSERVKCPVTEVLGADGLPIKIGETVYMESFGRPFTVVGFDGAYLKDADGGHLRADCATHTPPDTQERIDKDALMDAGKYVAGHPEAAGLREPPGSLSAKQAMMSDLLRRQRELDARTMGGAE